jgi:hypothetical protein
LEMFPHPAPVLSHTYQRSAIIKDRLGRCPAPSNPKTLPSPTNFGQLHQI